MIFQKQIFPVSRAHPEITIANFLQLPGPNMRQSDSIEHLATQLDISSSTSIGQFSTSSATTAYKTTASSFWRGSNIVPWSHSTLRESQAW
jgi:hypothetical protein